MNELSWLIYAADVTGTLKGVSAAAIGVAALTCGGAYLSRAFNGDMSRLFADSSSESLRAESQRYLSRRDAANKIFRPALIVAAVASLFFVFSPSSSTLYAIAASEMGERVIASETAGKAVQALNAWLDRQITAEAAK